ncbi:MAG: hypothetical protein AAB503_01985 [Patescibacteria group bacterium]
MNSHEKPGIVPDLEKPTKGNEQYEKLLIGAKNVINSLSLKRSPDNKKGETLLIVTDAGADELMIKALFDAGREIAGDDCSMIVAPRTEHAAQELGKTIGEKMLGADAILFLTSMSRSHSPESVNLLHPHHSSEVIGELLKKLPGAFPTLREKYSSGELTKMLEARRSDKSSEFPSQSRFISITNTDPRILTEGGALEDPVEMAERIEKFAKIMEGVERVRITNNDGTNMEVDIKVPSLMKESTVNKPGMAGNFPTGEFGGAADLAGTSGVFVVNGAIGMLGIPDKLITITIQNGVATKIEGGETAKKLFAILENANKEYKAKNPDDTVADAFRVAEFSFGMNSKALRSRDGKRESPPTSLEAEKGLGTVHIALGKNSLFNGVTSEDPDFNDIPIHIDCVILTPTVVGIHENNEEVELIRNGEVVCL